MGIGLNGMKMIEWCVVCDILQKAEAHISIVLTINDEEPLSLDPEGM